MLQTITIIPINELRYSSTGFKISDTSQMTYDVFDGNVGIMGTSGKTVGDLKADLSPYDGCTLKVVAAGTDVSDAAKFDVATELSNTTPISDGQIIAVKEADGTVSTYTVRIYAESEIPTTTGAAVSVTDLAAYTQALEEVVETDYTTDSWAAYQVVVGANVVTIANNQEEVDVATSAIRSAQNNLVPAINQTITTSSAVVVDPLP